MHTYMSMIHSSATFGLRLLLVALLGWTGARAEDGYTKDQPGSADHPALKRVEGSVIVAFEKQAFGTQCVALEKVVFDYDSQKIMPFQQEIVEGPQTRILYRAPMNASTLEVLRQYQTDLKGAGFELLFEGKGGSEDQSTLDNGYDRFLAQVYKNNGLPEKFSAPLGLNADTRYSALRKSSEVGKTYVTIYTVANSEWPDAFGTEKGQVLALVTVTEEQAMKDRMVKVTASEMDKSLSKSGRIALYGINFDFNKTEVKPDSAEALAEIGTLMKSNPALKVLIVGHTDSIGGFDMNKALSQRRAEAVVAALTSRFEVASNRLFPVGVSFAAPLESNESETGRAKNRRVELVKIVESGL